MKLKHSKPYRYLFILLIFFTLLNFNNIKAQEILKVEPQNFETVTEIDFEKAKIAEAVAKEFFNQLSNRNPEGLVELCGLPFAWDRVEIFSDKAELLAAFKKDFPEDVKPTKEQQAEIDSLKNNIKFKTHEAVKKLIDNIIPIDVYIVAFEFEIYDSFHGGRIAIEMTSEPKVTGYSD